MPKYFQAINALRSVVLNQGDQEPLGASGNSGKGAVG